MGYRGSDVPLALPALIVPDAVPSPREDRRPWGRLVPAGVISGLVHVLLLALFFLVNAPTDAETSSGIPAVFETKVEEEAPPPNLENDEIGLDPEVQTNFHVSRIEEVSVPGPVNANEAVGIHNAPEGPPTTLPPPLGLGDIGSGGGLGLPLPGTGNLVGLAGGLGALKLTPGGFGGRSGATRQQMLREGGGNSLTEAAVASGLLWLALHQSPDGRWALKDFAQVANCNCGVPGPANDVAGTAFALLPMLGAGHTHKTGADKSNRYTKVVERGLKYLLLQQNQNGSFNTDMYANGLAAITVCEAYALTSDPVLRPRAQRALDFICQAQNDLGGWDYSPRGPTPDTSIGVWQIMALKSGQMGGLNVPLTTLSKAKAWLDEWAGDQIGSTYGYRQPKGRNPSEGGASPQTMVAAGLLCRQYLGWSHLAPGLQRGAVWFLQPENLPLPANRRHMYYWYYATQVLHHLGGAPWKQWNALMSDLLLRTQDQGLDPRAPHQKGSWNPVGDWWCAPGGRIMITSMSLLTLEVYYRHLPLYRRGVGGDKALAER